MTDIKENLPRLCTLFLIKKNKGNGVNNEIKQNQQLAKELHKPIIKIF